MTYWDGVFFLSITVLLGGWACLHSGENPNAFNCALNCSPCHLVEFYGTEDVLPILWNLMRQSFLACSWHQTLSFASLHTVLSGKRESNAVHPHPPIQPPPVPAAAPILSMSQEAFRFQGERLKKGILPNVCRLPLQSRITLENLNLFRLMKRIHIIKTRYLEYLLSPLHRDRVWTGVNCKAFYCKIF